MDFTSFALWKRAPSSTSAAEEKTLHMMDERTRMAPLMGGGLLFREGVFGGSGQRGERKKPPARDRALEHDRQDASLWTCSVMSFVWYQILVSR